MNKSIIPFDQLYDATKYIEEWREMIKWCEHRKIRSKVLVQTFLNGVQPKGLGTMIAHKGFKKLDKVMDFFVVVYQQCCKAQSLLSSVGLQCEVKKTPPSAAAPAAAPAAVAAAAATAAAAAGKKQYADDKNMSAVGNKHKTNQNINKLDDVTCFKCGQSGHYSNKCTSVQKVMKKMKLRGAVEDVPTVGFFISGLNSDVHLVGQLDTGAEINLVPNTCRNAILGAGYKIFNDKTVEMIGITGHSICLNEYVIVNLGITGMGDEYMCNNVVLWLADIKQNEIIVGWKEINRGNMMKGLDSIINIQHALGVPLSSDVNDNVEDDFEDMDGNSCEPVWPWSASEVESLDSGVGTVSSDIVLPSVPNDCESREAIGLMLEQYKHLFGNLPMCNG